MQLSQEREREREREKKAGRKKGLHHVTSHEDVRVSVGLNSRIVPLLRSALHYHHLHQSEASEASQAYG